MDAYNGHFEMVDLGSIIVDHRYQREEKPALVAAIAADPRWELFGVPVLFRRPNGMFYCADGQQRITGMRNTAKPPKQVPAVWFPVEGLADEAAVFVHINEFRKSLSALEKHKGKIVAKDPATLAIERVVSGAGLSIGVNPTNAKSIQAVGTLYSIYNDLGEEGLLRVVTTCRDAFEFDSGAFSAPILTGVAEVVADLNGAFDQGKVIDSLRKTSVPQILRKTEELRYDIGGSRRKNVRRAIKALARV